MLRLKKSFCGDNAIDSSGGNPTMKIKKLHLNITNKCNLRCQYCFVSQRKRQGSNGERNEMDRDNALSLIKKAREYGIQHFSISGGEPLLHPGLLDMLDACGQQNRVVLFSNLHDIRDDLLDSIMSTGNVGEIKISLDGFEGHNVARFPSRYDEIAEKILHIKKIAPHCLITVNTIITNYNIEELIPLQPYLLNLSVNHWRLDLPMKSPNGNVYCSFERLLASAAKIIQIRYEIPEMQKMRLSMFGVYKSDLENICMADIEHLLSGNAHPCEYNFGQMAVNESGEITICTPLKMTLAKINNEENFSDVVDRYHNNPFFALTQDSVEHCSSCKFFKLCGTGCRAGALEWLGNENKPDPVACSVMSLIEEHIFPVLSTHTRAVYQKMINKEGNHPPYNLVSQRGIMSRTN